jgi:hypothetical protein
MIAIDILREEMEKAHGDLNVWQEDWIVKAMERYAQQQVKTNSTPDEGRDEELKCLMDNNKPNCDCKLGQCLKKGW